MTKNELAREVSVSEKLHLSTTVKAIDGTLRVIKEALAKGEVVVIRGFGTFTPVEVAENLLLHAIYHHLLLHCCGLKQATHSLCRVACRCH